jgi:hypothetical protein
VCLRLGGRGGGCDATEPGRFGDAELGVEVALAEGELAGLAEFAACGAEVALADLTELSADRAPGGAGAGLGEADDHEREEADQDVGADPLVFAVEDGPEQQGCGCR